MTGWGGMTELRERPAEDTGELPVQFRRGLGQPRPAAERPGTRARPGGGVDPDRLRPRPDRRLRRHLAQPGRPRPGLRLRHLLPQPADPGDPAVRVLRPAAGGDPAGQDRQLRRLALGLCRRLSGRGVPRRHPVGAEGRDRGRHRARPQADADPPAAGGAADAAQHPAGAGQQLHLAVQGHLAGRRHRGAGADLLCPQDQHRELPRDRDLDGDQPALRRHLHRHRHPAAPARARLAAPGGAR